MVVIIRTVIIIGSSSSNNNNNIKIIIPIVKFTDFSLSKTFLLKFRTLNAVKRKFPK